MQIEVQADGRVPIASEAQAGLHQRGRPAPDPWTGASWRLAYSPGAEWLMLGGGRGTAIHAVRTSQGWAGQLQGPAWARCGSLVVLRPDAAAVLAERLPEPPDTLRAARPPSAMERLIGRFSRREACDVDALAWIQIFLNRLGPDARMLRPPALRAAVAAMYADAVFQRAFGKTLADMGPVELQQLAAVVQSSSQCNGSPEQRALAGRTVQALALPLVDAPQHSRRALALDLVALDLQAHWAQALQLRLDAWAGEAPETLDPGDLRAARAAVQQFGPGSGLPSQGQALLAGLEALDSRAAAARADRAVLARAEDVPADLIELVKLLRMARRGPEGTVSASESVQQVVVERVNALLPAAVQQWANGLQGLPGWQQLQGWRSQLAELLARASADAQAAAQAVVDARQQVLADERVAAWQQEFHHQVDALPPGAEALAAGVALESRLRALSPAVLAWPALRPLAEHRAARRARDLAAATPALVALASEAPHLSALRTLRARYLLAGEENLPAAQAFAAAVQAREQQVAPWVGLPAEDYLNALYGGDVERLRALDAAFSRPYKAMLGASLQQIAPLMDLIGRANGVSVNTGAMMAKALDNISLVVPLMALYLVEFEGRLGPCLGPDAASFKVTRSSETVYRDGWGNFKYSVPNPDRVAYFKVPRRLAPAFEEVGLSTPDSALGQLVDNSFRSQGRVGVSDLLKGTRLMMRRFDEEGCGSPRMQRMEAQMLAHLARYRQGQAEVLDAASKPRTR
ncbi:hypothetical protein IP87_00795 [beta proteobacterium AAP121]|nr:hypothetical protein IP80_14195 [beta proteobacterium AAP65]KPG00902.1 hypothetical protein IP87_00795 [beta proteobacterium AAP121]